MMILETFLTGLLVVLSMKLWQKHIKRKEIWVIEDSDTDIMLLKINLQLEEYDVRYFKSIKGLQFKVVLSPPDAVICDYFLQDNVNGDQVRKFFLRNHIPIVLTTGFDGDIKGVPSDSIIYKSASPAFYRKVEQWVYSATT
jgi:response regulator RpfG family c-di-GMP phosphodiesterase